MLAYIVKRLVLAAVTLFLVANLVFLMFFIIPGGGTKREEGAFSGTAALLAGRNATPEDIARIDHELGLDRPRPEQYLDFIGGLPRLDFGTSYATGAPARDLVMEALPQTLSIAVGASVVWIVAGIAIGVISANKRGTAWDRVTMGLALAGLSIPVFTVSLVLLSLIYKNLGIYLANRYVPISQNPWAWLQAMWLPWISLAFPLVAVYARMVRGSMLEVASEDYMRTSLAKGLDEKQVLRHQIRGALTPVVTMYGLDFGLLLGGSVIVEPIFNIDGLGNLLLQSRSFYDFPVVAGVVVVGAIGVLVANLFVDVTYGILDPRVRVERSALARPT